MNTVKPSVLIEDALNALRQCEADNGYIIDMSIWHDMTFNGCSVCLAGAVMAKRLSMPRDSSYLRVYNSEERTGFIDTLSSETNALFIALDDFRNGLIRDGLWGCGVVDFDNYQLPEYFKITSYHDSEEEFYSDMELLVDVLKDEGL